MAAKTAEHEAHPRPTHREDAVPAGGARAQPPPYGIAMADAAGPNPAIPARTRDVTGMEVLASFRPSTASSGLCEGMLHGRRISLAGAGLAELRLHDPPFRSGPSHGLAALMGNQALAKALRVLHFRGLAPPSVDAVRRKLRGSPTKLEVRALTDVSFPTDDEARLDAQIAALQAQMLASGPYLGEVTYRNLPAQGAGADAGNLDRRAMKHALLSVITRHTEERDGMEIRVRVPLDDGVVVSYAMVILRFDEGRNADVELAGKDQQSKRSFLDAEASLAALSRRFEVSFVSDGFPATQQRSGRPSTFAGKSWSAHDAELLSQALPLVGTAERAVLKGVTFRRLEGRGPAGAAGFFSTADQSINLFDAALLYDKALWFGERNRFYSPGVRTVLHEIGHALHYAKAAGEKRSSRETALARFRTHVLAESRKRTGKAPQRKFPPPGITAPTDYAATSWKEFFADTYSIYVTNPSFLETPAHRYLQVFFSSEYAAASADVRPKLRASDAAADGPLRTETLPRRIRELIAVARTDAGSPLPASFRSAYEESYGVDLKHIRVHDGPTATASARALNARAYAVGHDVVFGAGEFRPRERQGIELLAHEVTHVVQSERAGSVLSGAPQAEAEADAVGRAVAEGTPMPRIQTAFGGADYAARKAVSVKQQGVDDVQRMINATVEELDAGDPSYKVLLKAWLIAGKQDGLKQFGMALADRPHAAFGTYLNAFLTYLHARGGDRLAELVVEDFRKAGLRLLKSGEQPKVDEALPGLTGAGLGSVLAYEGKTLVNLEGTDFYISGTPPDYWKGRTTSVLFIINKREPKKMYRLDYDVLKKGPRAGDKGWEHNQKGVAKVLGLKVSNHQPAGGWARVAGRAIQVFKWGGRALFVVGVGSQTVAIYYALDRRRAVWGTAASLVGGAAAGAGGAVAGARAGRVLGPWGAAAGALLGGAAGGWAASQLAKSAAEMGYDLLVTRIDQEEWSAFDEDEVETKEEAHSP